MNAKVLNHFEAVKDTYVIYQSFYQHANASADKVWDLFESLESALDFIVSHFSDALSNEQIADLKEDGVVGLDSCSVGAVLVSDIVEDDDFCQWVDDEDLNGKVIVEVANKGDRNTQKRRLVRSQYFMDC